MTSNIVTAQAIDCSQIADWSRDIGWDVDYQQVGRGAFEGKFSSAFCGSLRVTQQYCNRELAARGVPPPGMMSVLLPSDADNRTVIQGKALGKNDAAVMAAGSVGFLKSPRDLRMCTVSVPQAQLESALWDYGRCELSSVLSECGVTPFPRSVIQNLTETLNAVTCSKLEIKGKFAHLEVEDRILQAICAGLFSQEYEVTGRARTKYVFQAREYIDAHLGDVLRVGRIASNVGVSGRTLELAFRDQRPVKFIVSVHGDSGGDGHRGAGRADEFAVLGRAPLAVLQRYVDQVGVDNPVVLFGLFRQLKQALRLGVGLGHCPGCNVIAPAAVLGQEHDEAVGERIGDDHLHCSTKRSSKRLKILTIN